MDGCEGEGLLQARLDFGFEGVLGTLRVLVLRFNLLAGLGLARGEDMVMVGSRDSASTSTLRSISS